MSPLFRRAQRREAVADSVPPQTTGARPLPQHPSVPPAAAPPRPLPVAAASAAEEAPDEPVRLGGRYVLERVLGKGGEASVYAARDEALDRTVAIKLFHRRAVPPSQGMLEAAEARVGAALGHASLTTLFDTGIDVGPDGAPQLYMVMEYVRGETLSERLRRGAISPSDACWLGFDIAEGLDYMHQVGFVHRDVKPSNILISGLRSVRPVVAKLTDFGIAAPVGEPDLSEFTVGTAAYLSPEQVEGNDAVPASDTYSLGLVMIEAMTGRVVFPGSVTKSAFARLTEDPEIPEQIPPRTAALLRRMTERRPADRIGLGDAAVEMQQILAADLVRPRTGAIPVVPAAEPATTPGTRPAVQPSAATDSAVRLAAAAAGTSKGLLLRFDADGATRIVAAHGWGERPSVMETWPLRSEGGAGAWAIPDLLAHPVLFSHPVASAPHDVRAIAGAPLLAADGAVVGLLCVADEDAQAFSDARLGALQDAVALLQHDLQLRAAVRRAVLGAD
ncbi:serine/threonine-protein kinase [Amnibacterium kyonggiense]|uniref:non-specific serine/threonine protein kinase n=1 Tax=Amnibacterium kyonggiense TaxID=595671 RepID=A0A4R7FRB7_9MICO|nr:serine/threonine-protein kinase [Amnibacterium kyonggiense]TDS80276.1 serine/threonine protein kinase [Amnibacterium kyonggiense]